MKTEARKINGSQLLKSSLCDLAFVSQNFERARACEMALNANTFYPSVGSYIDKIDCAVFQSSSERIKIK